MIIRSLIFSISLMLLVSCSRGKVSVYREGDPHKRSFLSHVSGDKRPKGEHFLVKRNKQGQIVSAKHYRNKSELIEKSSYSYTRKGVLKRHRSTEYFENGPPRVAKEWLYSGNSLIQQEESWFTRTRSLEKRLTIYFDGSGRPYLEETWGLGRKIESSTEYYYDFKHRLDKSRRNFFNPDGGLRDYWITIYNDENQITHEEHYFANNDLIAFYRYSYHPVKGFREYEEVLDESRNVFISRSFDEYGLILVEEEQHRDLSPISRKTFEYSQNHKPLRVRYYDDKGQLVKTAKYSKPRYLERFRTPGI